MYSLHRWQRMDRHISVRKLRQWRMLSDGGNTLFDTLLAKLWETPQTFAYLNSITIPTGINFEMVLVLKGLLHIKRDDSRRIQVMRRQGVTTFTTELDIPEVVIEFKFPVRFACFYFTVKGKIEIEHIKVFMELSEKNEKVMLQFVKLVSINDYRTEFEDDHRYLRQLFNRRVSAILEETDVCMARTVDYYLGKAINRILATDELFL